MKRIAGELERIARELVAGDEWADEQTYEFAKQVAAEMKRAGTRVTRVTRNVIDFVHSPTILANVPLRMTLMEFGYEQSESVNGTIVSPENSAFRVPGGTTRTRDPKEFWREAEASLEEIFRMAMERG